MLTFAETPIHLVLNVTRASVIARAVKSKRIADFATVGRLELDEGPGWSKTLPEQETSSI